MSSHIISQTLLCSYLVISQSLSPNIIFVLTDDQDLELDSMLVMSKVKADIIDQGITFSNAFAATPICCPSRTETVAGRQYHNVQGTGIQCQGVAAYANLYTNTDSLFNKFHNNGYITGGFGKITNDMSFCNEDNAAPLTSFDRLHVSCNYYDFYWPNYFNKYIGQTTGEETTHTVTDKIYQTAMLGNASVEFISQQLTLQENNDPNAKPFILWIAPYAPHTPAFPSPWYQHQLNDITLIKQDNYNCDVSNHHLPLKDNPLITPDAEETMLLLHRNRLRSLLSVDDMVHDIVQTIDGFSNAGWSNTYLIYASDHGYHIGQYRVPCGKSQPYDTTLRIPLYIRGPRVVSGAVSDALVSNIDFLPTFLDIANISYSDSTYDGRSFKTIMENVNSFDYNNNWRKILLFEYKTIKGTPGGIGISKCASWDPDSTLPNNGQTKSTSAPNNWKLDNEDNNWRVLRIKNETINWMYGEFVSITWNAVAFANPVFYEFYDLNVDKYQLNNMYYTSLSAELKDILHALLMQYGVCNGAGSCSPIGLLDLSISDITTFSTSTTAISTTRRGKSGGGGKRGKNSVSNAAMKLTDYDYFNQDNSNFNDKDVFYIGIVLILCVAAIGCVFMVIGIWIGRKLEKRPHIVLEDKEW